MRRRLRSAAFPIHRHALPAGGVGRGAGRAGLLPGLSAPVRRRHPADCYSRPVRGGRSRSRSSARWSCFAVVGMYRHWMRYSSQREYLKIAEGVVLAVLALIGYVAVVQPQLISAPTRLRRRVTVPTGVLVLFGLLLGRVPDRHALPRAPALPAPAANGFRPRRDARSVLIVGAGDGGRLLLQRAAQEPGARLPAGRLRRRRPAEAGHARRGSRCSARPTTCRRCSTTSSPTR